MERSESRLQIKQEKKIGKTGEQNQCYSSSTNVGEINENLLDFRTMRALGRMCV